eukprot:g12323.t1
MASLSELREDIDAVDAKIKGVESKEERPEAALEGKGRAAGLPRTTDEGKGAAPEGRGANLREGARSPPPAENSGTSSWWSWLKQYPRPATLELFLEQSGVKPVTLLYQPAPVGATVTLELSPLWSFSALYPKPPLKKLQQAARGPEAICLSGGQQSKWNVRASPDGSLEDLSTGRESPCLFREADSCDGRVSQSFGLDEKRSFCAAGDAGGVFLGGALERLGLNMRERCDMVTYWLPQLESSPFNVICLVHVERHEKAARPTITPALDVTIRIFMAFRGADAYDAELDTATTEDL